MIIAVCGTISSGKTTLSKKICKLFNFSYIPQRRQELSFLDEFFQDIPNAFFKTQVSFLVSKTLEIGELGGKNIVIDRSLYEDININAQLWMDLYPIEEKDKILYKSISTYLCSTIPQPDVYIICRCEWENLQKRYKQRPRRQFEEFYPQGYLEQLFQRYQSITFPEDAYVIEVDTDHIDIRADESAIKIVDYIVNCAKQEEYEQLSLFTVGNSRENKKEKSEEYIRLIQKPSDRLMEGLSSSPLRKQIYLAAPFTEFATEKPSVNANQISLGVDTSREYNILPQKYQKFLKRLKKLISCSGEYDVILPHQNENNWGRTYKTSEQIVHAMIDNMRNSDLLVAVVSNSIGVHMEMAMMSIQQKPMVLIILDNLTTGFYAAGHRWQDNTKVLHAHSLQDVFNAIKRNDVISFIRGELENEKMDTKKL